ncbi:MAG: prepilin-type N-terminal cleavage/methylation domain-containing protein [Clostridiales bacterium]|nr:prepilin-type N-terminal cleavage/methylation domain-containing protein [Clostridiales bacterium]
MRKDNRGLSLVELIISIAISVIIMGAAMLLLSSALRNYNFASATISMQSQAQVLMEQISKWTMEGNRLEVGTTSEGAGYRYLIIWDIPTSYTEIVTSSTSTSTGTDADADSASASASTASNRVIWYSDSGKELYMATFDKISVDDVDSWSNSMTGKLTSCMTSDVKEKYLIGDSITSATIDYTDDSKNDEVAISLTFKKGTQEYTLSNDFKVRNMVVMDWDALRAFA